MPQKYQVAAGRLGGFPFGFGAEGSDAGKDDHGDEGGSAGQIMHCGFLFRVSVPDKNE